MYCIIVYYGECFVQVIKLDVETKLQVEWSAENCWPAEPVFVARPGASEEDDGEMYNYTYNYILFFQFTLNIQCSRHGLVIKSHMFWLYILLTCPSLLVMFRCSPNSSH